MGLPPGAVEIQIFEPLTFEIETPSIPLLPTISTPPLDVQIPPPISIKYECPMSVYCGTDVPCAWSYTIPNIPMPPLPTFSFPPQFKFPTFKFKFELPPSIFIKCPAFPDDDFNTNKQNASSGNTEKTTKTNTAQPVKENGATVDMSDNKNKEYLRAYIGNIS